MSIYLLPVAMLVGAWLHELIHAVAAIVVGGSVVAVDLWNLHVDFTAPSERREWLVRQSPAILGLLALPALFWTVSFDSRGLVAFVGWAMVTLSGGRGEIGLV